MMLNSRDINLLRPDVAANCRIFISKMKALGYPVAVMTVRDDEYQMDCFRRGAGGRPPATFHAIHAGLAFDVFKNIKGQEYADAEMFRVAGQIGKSLGFTWGGNWKNPDRPHFQWDAYGRYTDSNIIARKYPPAMPLYEEVEDMTEEQTRRIVREEFAGQNMGYKNLDDVPMWGKPTVQKLLDRKALNDGKETNIDVSYDLLRQLVINDRMGVYDIPAGSGKIIGGCGDSSGSRKVFETTGGI